ncbi:serine protease [Actinoplanes sp. DH11]|uniref:serine protease n=1 Tax=Actinoplanes sp. DH11 TaxID=2857011 RepID=UPI001E41B98A|nr:serine protease [Actinoplanes sp. DH11]
MVRNVVSLLAVAAVTLLLSAAPVRAGDDRRGVTGDEWRRSADDEWRIAGDAWRRIAGDGRQRIPEVIGGKVAAVGRFPWAVRLSMGCGGALTAPRVVLTAGHCVGETGPNTKITITAGAPDLRSKRAVSVRSVEVFRSPDFVTETRGDDWAVVKLERALSLPTLALVPDGSRDAGTFTVMGWGQTQETSVRQEQRLHYANVPTIPDEACAKAYRQAGVELVRDESICAGRHGVDTCQGDSGGPMVRRDGSRWVQVGIVSWGLGCARDGYFGVYTQISKFRVAIREATAKLS